MNKIPESGYYNSNKFARIFLESIREISGNNGLNTILNYSKLSALVDNLPPDNLDKAFDFAHFSMINQALEDIYGLRGGRGLALRIGRTTFADVLKDYGALAGVGDLAYRVLPLQLKIIYSVERCPVCWGRTVDDRAVCYYMIGLLQEGLHWVSGGEEFMIYETKCIALGHDICEFTIPKEPQDK